jgi:hypothetical protein
MLNQLASLARVDFSPQHRQPSAGRVLLATIASIAGSPAADAGTWADPRGGRGPSPAGSRRGLEIWTIHRESHKMSQ